MPFNFIQQEIPGLVIIEPRVFNDSRGFFLESYKKSDFLTNGINYDFVQDNHSLSKKNVIRGLHFQHSPKGQGKLVRVMKGSAWDVAVDIRKSSPTYRKWLAFELSETNNKMLFIPPGFAHGFAALTDDMHLMYKCTEEYDQGHDAGIRWNDPEIGVKWPVCNPVLSDKDAILPYLRNVKISG
jgi:dTDP-4-dehydrorhamnose 3,5-epimerase